MWGQPGQVHQETAGWGPTEDLPNGDVRRALQTLNADARDLFKGTGKRKGHVRALEIFRLSQNVLAWMLLEHAALSWDGQHSAQNKLPVPSLPT